jgi:hypothetical protein
MISDFTVGSTIVGYILDKNGTSIGGSAQLEHRADAIYLTLVWHDLHHPTQQAWFGDTFTQNDDGKTQSFMNSDPNVSPIMQMTDGIHTYSLIGCRIEGGIERLLRSFETNDSTGRNCLRLTS